MLMRIILVEMSNDYAQERISEIEFMRSGARMEDEFNRKYVSFVALKGKKMIAKEGRFINLAMRRQVSCLLAAVFLLNFSDFVAKSSSKNEGSKKGAEN